MMAAYLLLLVLVQGLEPGFLQMDTRSEPPDLADAALADAGVSEEAPVAQPVAQPAQLAAAMKRAHAFVHDARVHALIHGVRKAGPYNESHDTASPSGKFVCPYNQDGDYSAEEDHPEYSIRCAKLELLVNDVTDAERKLHENVVAQSDARRRLKRMADASERGIAAEDPKIQDYQAKVTAETASRGLAEMLGGLWREMRMFAAPSYSVLLRETLAELSEEERSLRRRLASARAAVDDLRARYVLEDAGLVKRQEAAWRRGRG